MLFDFATPRRTFFQCWFMRFPIDMALVGDDGVVRRVFRECAPGGIRVFVAWRPVRFVLETPTNMFPLDQGDKISIGRPGNGNR